MRIAIILFLISLLPTVQISAFSAQSAEPTTIESMQHFSDGFAGVSVDGKWGFINKNGKMEVAPEFLEVRPFHDGHAAVKLVSKWGLIDKKGHYVVNPDYDDMGVFAEGLVAVKVNGQWGYINKEDKMIIPPQFSETRPFSSDLAAVRIESNWGFIDNDGRFAINPRFSEAGTFAGGLAPVQVDGEWGFIDKKGDLAIKPQFQKTLGFSDTDELAAVQIDSLWGFIKTDGHFEINPEYDNAGTFAEGLAPVQKDGKWGFVDRKGKITVGFQYQEAGGFSNGRARVVSGDTATFIEPSGKDAGVGVSVRIVSAVAVPVVTAPPPSEKAAAPVAPQPTEKAAAPVAPQKSAPVAVPVVETGTTPQKVSAPFTTGDADSNTADIEPLGTLWQKALVPKHRPIISFMDPDENIYAFRGTEAYFAFSDGTLPDGKTGYTDADGKQVSVTVPETLDQYYERNGDFLTSPQKLKLSGDKSRPFSIAQAPGVVPKTFQTSVPVMGTNSFAGVPMGVIGSSYLTKDDEDGTTTHLWMDLAGRLGDDVITKDTLPAKLKPVRLETDMNGKALPRPYYKYKFNADGSHKYAPALSMGLAHDMVAWDWNNDGYTDYLVSYVTNKAGEKDWKNMKVALVFVDGESLYNASQGTGSVNFWVDTSSEYTTNGDVVGGLTDVKPSNSVRMAIGDLDGDNQPEVALYFTKVCGPSGLAHNNTLRVLKLAYQNVDPNTGKITNTIPDWDWVISEDNGYGKWYLQYDSVAMAIGDLDGNGKNELVVLHGHTAALYQPSRVYLDIYNLKVNKASDCKKDGTGCKTVYSLDHPVSGSDNDPIAHTSKMPKNKKSNPVLQASIADLDGDGTGELVWVGTTKDDSNKLKINVRSWKKYTPTDPDDTNTDKSTINPLKDEMGSGYLYELTTMSPDWTLDSDHIRYAMTTGRFVYPEADSAASTVRLLEHIGLVTTTKGSNDGNVGLRWGIFTWGCDGGPCSASGTPALTLLGSGAKKDVAKAIDVGPSIVAADLYGDSMIIGQGVKTTVTDATETLFNIQAPPKHYDEFTYNGVEYKMDAFSTLEDYKTTLSFEASQKHATSTTTISNGKFDSTLGLSLLNDHKHGNNIPAPYVNAGLQGAYDLVYTKRVDDTVESTYDVTTDCENDDSLLYRSNSHDLWRYPILYPPAVATQTVAVTDPDTGKTSDVPTQSYIQFVVPQEISDTVTAWGGDVSWYQPRHNNLNLFSYPTTLKDILGYPQGEASKTADDWWKEINGTSLVTVSGKTIGNLNSGELVFSLESDSSTEITDNLEGTIGGYLNLAPAVLDVEYQIDVSAEATFGTDSVTTTDASNLMKITVSTPGVGAYEGQSDPKVLPAQQNFTVDGSVYTTDSGVYSLGFAVTNLKNRTSAIWGATSPYQMAADPALNLPRMYTKENDKWVPNRLADPSTGLDVSNSHEIRGIQFNSAKYFTQTGLNGQAIPVDTKVSSTIRIYNYSFVTTGTVSVDVKFQAIDGPDAPPDVTKATTLATIDKIIIPGRDSGADNWQDMKISWTTPSQPTYGYLHVVLSTPDVTIEPGTGKAIIKYDTDNNAVYGGGNLNPNNDAGYVLVGIYDPQATATAAPKAVKSAATNMKGGAVAAGSTSASNSKTLKVVTDSFAVRPIKSGSLEGATTTLGAGQKAIIQAQIRFDDATGDKAGAVTRVNVYLRAGKRIIGHKIVPLLFNGKACTVRMPYTAPETAQSVPLEMIVTAAALPLSADSSPAGRTAKMALTISQP